MHQVDFVYKKTLFIYNEISSGHDVGILRRFYLDLIYFKMSYDITILA